LINFEAQGIIYININMEDDYDTDEFEQAVAAVEEMENDMAGGQVEEEIESDGEDEGIITQSNPF
jgi:hypothetical protein